MRRTRFVKGALAILIMLSLSLLLAWGTLFYSEPGARWAWARVSGFIEGLRADSVSGTIASGLTLRNVSYSLPGMDLHADTLKLEAGIGLWPLDVELALLDVDQLVVNLKQPASAGGEPAATVSRLEAPVPVSVEHLVVHRLRVEGEEWPAATGPLYVRFSGRWGQNLEADELRIEGNGFGLSLGGFAGLDAPYPHELSGRLALPEPLSNRIGWLSPGLELEATGDSALSTLNVHQDDGQLQLNAQLSHWLSQPGWSARGAVTDLSLDIGQQQADPLLIRTLQLEAWGSDRNFNLDISAQARQAFVGDISWHASAEGDLFGVRLRDSRVEADCASGKVDVDALWTAGVSARLFAVLDRLDPGCWVAPWPEGQEMAGALELSWDKDILSIPALNMRLKGSQARFSGGGRWRPGVSFDDVHLGWTDVHWPVTGEPLVLSPEGLVRLEGRLEDWRLDGEITIQAPPYPEAKLMLQGHGNESSAGIELDRSVIMGGTLQGTVHADWSGPPDWNAELNASRIDLGAIWPDWPALVNVRASAFREPSSPDTVIHLSDLSGTLRGEALSGAGTVRLRPGRLAFESVELLAPNSRLRLDGDPEQGIGFTVHAARPGLFARLARAEIQGQGTWRTAGGLPEIELDLALKDVRGQDLSIDEARIAGSAGPATEDALMEATLRGVSIDQVQIQHARAVLSHIGQQQQIRLEAEDGAQQLAASLRGELTGWHSPSELAFSGELSHLRYAHAQQAMTLKKPARLSINGDHLELEEACLETAPADALCLQAGWQQGAWMELQGRVQALPLQWLGDAFSADLEFSQHLDGHLTWRQKTGTRPSGAVSLTLTPGLIRHGANEWEDLQTGPGEFAFRIEDGQLLGGRLRLPLPGLGGVVADYAISELSRAGMGDIDGQLRVEVDDLYPLQVFLPYLSRLSGQLAVDARILGQVAAPHLEGQVMLQEARFDVPALGLKRVRLNLDGQVSRQDQLTARGRLAMGEGEADVDLLLDLAHWGAPRVEWKIEGDDLQVINLPNFNATAHTRLEMGWQSGDWAIGGKLSIPKARIVPNTAIAERISESADVVIVAGERPEVENTSSSEAHVTGHVMVTLGDEVSVETPALALNAAGEVALDWSGDPIPSATGVVYLNGEIRSYGPRLQVNNGRIRFQGGPVNEPRLDVRAERSIFGNTQIQSAGVRIAGTASRPRIEAYTHPETTEERAWTLLVTGSDFQYGQGVGAFDIGTYIAPRLYISYGISLVDEARTVSVRYDLRKGFGIKATSSEEDNGVDISYTIER